MTKYKIIVSTNTQELESFVLGFLEDGWAPQGGLSVLRGGLGDNTYYQAMIK